MKICVTRDSTATVRLNACYNISYGEYIKILVVNALLYFPFDVKGFYLRLLHAWIIYNDLVIALHKHKHIFSYDKFHCWIHPRQLFLRGTGLVPLCALGSEQSAAAALGASSLRCPRGGGGQVLGVTQAPTAAFLQNTRTNEVPSATRHGRGYMARRNHASYFKANSGCLYRLYL